MYNGVRNGRGPGTYMVLCYMFSNGVVAKMGVEIGSLYRLLATSSGRWELQVVHTFYKQVLGMSKGQGLRY